MLEYAPISLVDAVARRLLTLNRIATWNVIFALLCIAVLALASDMPDVPLTVLWIMLLLAFFISYVLLALALFGARMLRPPKWIVIWTFCIGGIAALWGVGFLFFLTIL
jgi:RsiW-degrading membrane proteinase PrsW (M82 family)